MNRSTTDGASNYRVDARSQLSRITVFPITSLDGKGLQVARVLPSGALEHDRRWAIVDEDGALVTGKRTAIIHAIPADYDNDFATVRLRRGSDAASSRCLTRSSKRCFEAGGFASGASCRRATRKPERASLAFPRRSPNVDALSSRPHRPATSSTISIESPSTRASIQCTIKVRFAWETRSD